MKTYQVYLAGPISGLSLKGGTTWRDYVSENTNPEVICLSPLRNKEYLADRITLEGSYEEYPLSTQRGIYTRDKFDCHRADLILVNLVGAKTVSIGTVMEIAWGAQADKPIVLVMEKGNIHNHPMLKEACPFIVETVDDAITLIHALLLPECKMQGA